MRYTISHNSNQISSTVENVCICMFKLSLLAGDSKTLNLISAFVHWLINLPFQTLLPKGCCKVIGWSDTYIDSWRCNFLGLKPGVEIPKHVELYVALDVVIRDRNRTPVPDKPFMGYSFLLQSPQELRGKGKRDLDTMTIQKYMK